MAGECGCLLPVVSEIKCEKTIVLSPTYKQVKIRAVTEKFISVREGCEVAEKGLGTVM